MHKQQGQRRRAQLGRHGKESGPSGPEHERLSAQGPLELSTELPALSLGRCGAGRAAAVASVAVGGEWHHALFPSIFSVPADHLQ